MVNVPALETDATAFADVAGGDDAKVAVASNGRQIPSILKVIKDQLRWKPPILYVGSISITDVLQPFTSGIDGFVYAPAPGKVPFTAAVDPSTDAVNWFLVQGYVQGSGVDLDLAAIGSIINALNITLSGVLTGDSTTGQNMALNKNGALRNNSILTLNDVAGSGSVAENFALFRIIQTGAAVSPMASFGGKTIIDAAGQVQGIAGLVTSPSYAFLNDLDTGMYSISGGRIGFATNGIQALQLDATLGAEFKGNINPTVSGTQDLGSLTVGWDKLFLTPNANDAANIADAAIVFKSAVQTYWFQKRASGQDLQLCHDTDGGGIGGLPVIHSSWDDDTYRPGITEVLDLGSTSFEWDNIFVQNSPTVSDERTKNDLGSAVSLIPVMKLLDPRIFSRKSKIVEEAVLETTEQRQKTELVKEQKIEIIDNIPVLKMVDVARPLFKMVTLKDENGVSVKKDGKVVKYPVPDMEDYIIPAKAERIVSHGRPHTGFMAQAVKQAMIDAGIDDWAGYAHHNDGDEDLHVLRLLEFIAPMLAYIQELEGRIKTLEGV